MIRLRVTIMVCALLVMSNSTLQTCDNSTCALPDCYCQYRDIPGGLSASDTPQMVLFTYTGPVTKKIRQAISDVFSDTLKNPNKCSIGITMYIVSQGSDDCAVYRAYYRGHEIALAGMNRTSWRGTDWGFLLGSQLSHLSEFSHVDIGHITGVRAQQMRPGGDEQYEVLQNIGLQYDSSLLAGYQASADHPYLWPFTLYKPLKELGIPCLNPTCPTAEYPMVWEIPISSLSSMRMGKARACTYLDDCITNLKTPTDLSNLLKRHFLDSYNGNRAPFQVNLQPRSLDISIIVEGLKDFIRFVLSKDDSWIVTSQEALEWVQEPQISEDIVSSGFWSCQERGVYHECVSVTTDAGKAELSMSIRSMLHVDRILLIQTISTFLVFIVIYRYDHDRNNHNLDDDNDE